jgi:hypothetical protein
LDGDTKKIKERKNNKTIQGSQGVVSRNEDIVQSSVHWGFWTVCFHCSTEADKKWRKTAGGKQI